MGSEADKVGRDFRDLIERSMRHLQFRCFQALTSANPVDTGFSRSRWSVETGAPIPAAVNRPADADLARAQAQVLFSAHRAASEALRNGYVLSQGPIFILNDASYMVYLNAGSSPQAPPMFIERAIDTAVQATQRELRQ